MIEAWVDIETTGTDGARHALIQFTIGIYIEGKQVDFADYTFRPLPGDKVNKDALKATGHTLESLLQLDDPYQSFSRLKGFLGKYMNPYSKAKPKKRLMFYAYNAQFDYSFFLSWCKTKMGFPYMPGYFYWPPVDVASIVSDRRKDLRAELHDFKLSTVAKALEIEVEEEKLHDSSYDIWLTREIYDRVQ